MASFARGQMRLAFDSGLARLILIKAVEDRPFQARSPEVSFGSIRCATRDRKLSYRLLGKWAPGSRVIDYRLSSPLSDSGGFCRAGEGARAGMRSMATTQLSKKGLNDLRTGWSISDSSISSEMIPHCAE
jgi:hypothetical protein